MKRELKGRNRNRNTNGFYRGFLINLGFKNKKVKRHSFKFMLGLKLASRRFENPETLEDKMRVFEILM